MYGAIQVIYEAPCNVVYYLDYPVIITEELATTQITTTAYVNSTISWHTLVTHNTKSNAAFYIKGNLNHQVKLEQQVAYFDTNYYVSGKLNLNSMSVPVQDYRNIQVIHEENNSTSCLEYRAFLDDNCTLKYNVNSKCATGISSVHMEQKTYTMLLGKNIRCQVSPTLHVVNKNTTANHAYRTWVLTDEQQQYLASRSLSMKECRSILLKILQDHENSVFRY